MVNIDIGSMSAQGTSVATSVGSRVAALQQGIQSLNDFIEAHDLQGAAYTSAKQYATNVLTPLLRASILYSECVGEKTAALEQLYASYCSESLDSDVLEAQIRQYESSIQSAFTTYHLLSRDPDSSLSLQNNVLSTIHEMQSQLHQLRDKLRRLYQFHAASARTFESIASLEAALMTGLNQVQQSFTSYNSDTGFVTPKDMSWATEVSKKWKKREKIIDDYRRVVKKAESGVELTQEDLEAATKYQSNFPTNELPNSISNSIENSGEVESEKVLNWMGLAFTGNLAYKEAVASYKKIKNGTFWRSVVKSTKTGFKTWNQVMGDVNRFKIVKQAKKLDEMINGTGTFVKGSGIKGFTKSIGVLGALSAGPE